MKTALLSLLSLFFYIQTFADCSSSAIWASPSSSTLPQNQQIVLEGYGMSQRFIDSLNSIYFIYLSTDDEKVKIIVQETNKGMFGLTQAILKPKKPLTIGKTYTLVIDSLPEWAENTMKRYNNTTHDYEPITWTIVEAVESTPSTWLSPPKFKDKSCEHFGCGPAIYTNFSASVSSPNETLIKTQLVDLNTNDTSSYYLYINNNDEIKVGRNMCSGAFDYQSKHNYAVRFKLSNVYGKTNANWTEWIQFKSPYKR